MTAVGSAAPRLRNPAEQRVWQHLTEQLQPDDLVVANQRVTDHLKDHEIDFVVAIDGAGIVCLEVKGGEVWHDGEHWWQGQGERKHRIHPVRQAREACYALRDYVESDPRWTQDRLRWGHLVVLPNTELPADFELPDCPRWQIVDRNELPTLVDKLRHALIRQELDRPLLTAAGIDQLRTALSGRGLPQRDVVARALANNDAADALTEHQAVILDAIRLLNPEVPESVEAVIHKALSREARERYSSVTEFRHAFLDAVLPVVGTSTDIAALALARAPGAATLGADAAAARAESARGGRLARLLPLRFRKA